MPFDFDPAAVPVDPAESGETAEPPKRSRSWGAWVAALVLVAVVVAGAYWYLRRTAQPAAPAPVAAAPSAPAQDATAGPSVDSATADPTVRDALGQLIDSPDARWFSGGDLTRRIAGVIAAVANGEDPRSFLLPIAPTAAFTVTDANGQAVISEASQARFDWIAQQLSTAHPDRVGAAWNRIHPLVAAAWKEIAPPGRSLDEALNHAVANLLAVPVPNGPVPVVAHGAVYQFADPKLEALSPAQKILLRMGPKNEKVVQDTVRAFGRALALPAAR